MELIKWLVGVAVGAFIVGFGALAFLEGAIDKRITAATKEDGLISKVYDSRLTEIESKLDDVASTSGIPEKLVAAFSRSEESPCPTGWSLYDDAKSRFILGAGHGSNLSSRNFNSHGGKEEVTLKPKNMPNHSHSFESAVSRTTANDGRGAGALVKDPGARQTSKVGGDAAFEIMPPYIALYYCIKG